MNFVRSSTILAPLLLFFSGAVGLAQNPGIEIVAAFKGHTEPVYAVAFTPDGKHLVTGSFDNTVRLWSLASKKEERLLAGPAGHTKMVLSLAVRGDGSLLATGGADASLKFWDLPIEIPPLDLPVPRVLRLLGSAPYAVVFNTAALVVADAKAGPKVTALTLKPFAHGNAHVDSIAFHPRNPNILATGAHDGRIRIFDLAKKALQKEIIAHADKDKTHPIYTIAFSPDGSQILSASYDHSLKLYDATSGSLIRVFKGQNVKDFPKGHADEVYSAAFSPDGALIASGSGGFENGLKIWKTDDGTVVRDLVNPSLPGVTKEGGPAHPGWIYHVRFLKDGRLVSVGDAPKNHGYIALWDVKAGKLLHGESTAFGSIYGFAISADEKTIALGAGNRGRTKGDFNNAYLVRVPGINR